MITTTMGDRRLTKGERTKVVKRFVDLRKHGQGWKTSAAIANKDLCPTCFKQSECNKTRCFHPINVHRWARELNIHLPE